MSGHAYVRRDHWERLGVREWGLPTGMFPGAAWRNRDAEDPKMACIVEEAPGSETVLVQIRPVKFIEGKARLPAGWRRALAQYVRRWPASAGVRAVWADLSSAADRVRIAVRLLTEGDAHPDYRRYKAAQILEREHV